ncbi:MAG: [FeFe] hydrogenase, group A [Synergistaceae bacterium]|jgi:NADH-quinone oxidoreductase subunit G/NADP-reducing hydrogenase subunit HndD|nr:[FeFe] hydrogenase, group A [Synergistaceae bacterium]
MSSVKETTVTMTIDGQDVTVPKSYTVLQAARLVGINIPHLCYHPELAREGSCRVCLVEVEGARSLAASCVYPVSEGMKVRTNTPAVRETRRTVVELMLANHPEDCLFCVKNQHCELQEIAADLGVRKVRFRGDKREAQKDEANPSIVRDPQKCILCTRCVRACSERQGLDIFSSVNRGFNSIVEPAFGLGLDEVACSYCGQCTTVCPTAALTEKDDTQLVWDALADPGKFVAVQTAPSVRIGLGEEFGLKSGGIVTGKMVAALRRFGFDRVFDTDFAADLTIMEEGHELLHRVANGGVMPMMTSCSPGWINFVETTHPEMIPHLSTAKSPQGMFGAAVKTYFAERENIDPSKIVSVSVMPCTAKKWEAKRPQLCDSGYRDVDIVITTRELARMIKQTGIDFMNLPEEEFDNPMGISSGAGQIFGATGGVMEAALRTAYEVYTGRTLDNLDFLDVRGLAGIKEASVDMGDGLVLKVAVAHTLRNAEKLIGKIKSGEADYHFIEIMACPGGCLGGGGQPYPTDAEIRQSRIDAIYRADASMKYRKSHENPAIIELYDTWMGKPLGERAHHLLHTHFTPWGGRLK